MRTSGVGPYALSSCVAAAMLAGCGGSQLPTGVPLTTVAPDSYLNHHTFHYTGKRQWFKVPSGVKWIDVILRGAAGGGTLGGRGGRIHAIVPVTPGERLAVYVGGQGENGNGGFNGGANGGVLDQDVGSGGGGASDMREGGDRLANRILVAGGGGGQGGEQGYSCTDGQDGNGGNGGSSVGDSGVAGCPYYNYSGDGGTGGTQYQGGLGGHGGGGPYGFGNPGADGSLGSGGAGGANCTYTYSCQAGGSGGGGGGGYFGGGGGGVGGGGPSGAYGGGGGGGGSSYVEPSAKKFRSWKGWKDATGNGIVVVHWQ